MPRLRSKIACNRRYRDREVEQMKLGVIPEQMEDKWFIFWEKDTLHFHRSWTGFCTYRVKFRRLKSGWRMWQITANRNPEQYRGTDERDIIEVPFLIDLLLLRKAFDWPDDASPEAAVELWHHVGRAFIGQHPDSDSDG